VSQSLRRPHLEADVSYRNCIQYKRQAILEVISMEAIGTTVCADADLSYMSVVRKQRELNYGYLAAIADRISQRPIQSVGSG
jgi:hypothetical protein